MIQQSNWLLYVGLRAFIRCRRN